MRFTTALFPLIIIPLVSFGFAEPPDDNCNNPPDYENCTACHGDYGLNSGDGSLVLTGLPPDGFVPNQTYDLTLTLSDPGQSCWAFEITCEYQPVSVWQQAGSFTITQSNYTQLSLGSGSDPDFVKNTYAGLYSGSAGAVSWRFNWTAPGASAQSAGFYFVGNACNDDGETAGDYVYAGNITLNQYAPPQPPVVSDIPDQTQSYLAGWTFQQIYLDDYVNDPDTPDEQIVWTSAGSQNLQVDIVNRVATIYSNVTMFWYGTETITFIATDPTNLSDSDEVNFTITAYPPVVSDIPNQTIFLGDNFTPINLSDYVEDPDTPDSMMVWEWYNSGTDHIDIQIVNQVAIITPIDSTWTGSDEILFTAHYEPVFADSDYVTFTVLPAGVAAENRSGIPANFALKPAYPNPFNPQTTLSFTLAHSGQTELVLYDNSGRRLQNLFSGTLSAGYYNVNANLREYASGVYVVSLKAGEYSAAQKIVLIK